MASFSTPLLHLLASLLILSSLCYYGVSLQGNSQNNTLTLDFVREFLTKQEDSIVFCLIDRAKYPLNSPAYDPSYLYRDGRNGNYSIAELLIRETEAAQAKAGHYENPVEIPFSPNLPRPLAPSYNFPQVLYPLAASFNVSKTIWDMYFNNILSLFLDNDDDGNYALAVASDIVCLQALSRRIHYGRYVSEVKFQNAMKDYVDAIRAQDQNTLMTLVTSPSQEEIVVRRVEKKAKLFGQNVTLDTNNSMPSMYKVDPLVVARLYKDWVIPITKVVEVEYLLHRLD